MSVTKGFLRISEAELAALEQDPDAFEQRCEYDSGPDYLDMDKSGIELLLILDPSALQYDNPDAKQPYPGISNLLGGGVAVHPEIDMGYGPAMKISKAMIEDFLNEFVGLDFDECLKMATDEMLAEVMLCEIDESMFRDYHWSYLQSLGQFVADTRVAGGVLLRY